MDKTHLEWINKADEDFLFASTHLKDEERFFAQLCFHFHQAAEKYLKGCIVFYDLEFRKIHNLKELWRMCQSKDAEFATIEDACIYLNQFYIDTRYPVTWPSEYLKNDAVKAKKAAGKIRRFVYSKLELKLTELN